MPYRLLALLAILASCRLAPVDRAEWRPLESPTRASLRGLHVVDRRTIWCSGSGGTVVRSVDGGGHFEVYVVPGEEHNELRDVHGFDARTACFIACQPARVYRTTDGGASFECVLDAGDESAFFDGLSFFDRARGIVFGDPIDGRLMIYTTRDGGDSWQRVPASDIPPALDGEGAFAASGTCLTVHGAGSAWIGTGIAGARVLYSTDYGRSFRVADTPMVCGEAAGIFSLAFRDAGRGVAVGGDYRPGRRGVDHAAFTRDAGRTWRLAAVPPRAYRSCAVYVPGRPRTLLAVGPTGTDLSEDDGRTWRRLSDTGFHVVSFAADGTGFAAGSGGRIARLDYP